MDQFSIHGVFPGQMLLISHPVRRIPTWTLLFQLLPIMTLCLDRCTFTFVVKGIMEGPGVTLLSHSKVSNAS